MKKLVAFVIVVLTLVGCNDEVEFNTPALQGQKNYELWRAKFSSASIDNTGALVITGGNNFETLTLKLPSATIGTYALGEGVVAEAIFVDADGVEYSTNNMADPDVDVYSDYGEIVLEEIDVANNTYSGTFRFNAFNSDGTEVVNFGGNTNEEVGPVTGGVFYQIPLISGNTP